MLLATELIRAFKMQDKGVDIELADPGKTLSPEAVLNFYSNNYPVLTTATIEGPAIENDRVIYHFRTTIGTKG